MPLAQVATEVALSGMATAIVAMATVIGVLWRSYFKKNESIEQRLKDCEKDRSELWTHVRQLEDLCDEDECPLRRIKR